MLQIRITEIFQAEEVPMTPLAGAGLHGLVSLPEVEGLFLRSLLLRHNHQNRSYHTAPGVTRLGFQI